MYVGSAALMMPQIQKAKENQNGILGFCSAITGATLAIGLGSIASKLMNKAIDKGVHFWDEVKPKDATDE